MEMRIQGKDEQQTGKRAAYNNWMNTGGWWGGFFFLHRWRTKVSCVCASLCQSFSDQSLCCGWQMGPVVVPPERWHTTPTLGTHARTYTQNKFSSNCTAFPASMAAELTDWEQTGRQAISSDTWERPKDPRTSRQVKGTDGYAAKYQLAPPPWWKSSIKKTN